MDRDHRRTLDGVRVAQVARIPFLPADERRSVLDRAHRGDIVGGLGRVDLVDSGPRRSLRRRVATLAAIMGPGIVVMVADNDAGGVSTYAQAGQEYGFRLVWLLVLLAPVLFVNQEMVARLGAVTGVGHARLIYERFGRRWGMFALTDLVLLNFLTIVTEFIGVALALGYFGISKYVAVPFAAVGLAVATATGSFRRWERTMFVLVALSLLAIPLAVLTRAHSDVLHVTPSAAASGHLGGGTVVFVIALIGTTVAPWQLFFQQSYVVDKRITPRWINYERADTMLGTVLFSVGAIAVMATCAIALRSSAMHEAFSDARHVAEGLRDQAGPWQAGLFAAILLTGSILGAAAVSLATSYAVGDVLGTKHSLHRGWRDAPAFHGSFVLLIGVAAGIVLVPGAPLGVVTAGVQVLAGVLLPSATIFLLLLCNDVEVLGPWVNRRWLNVVTGSIVATLVALSGLLIWSTLFGNVSPYTAISVIGVAMLSVPVALLRFKRQVRGKSTRAQLRHDRAMWCMPALETLSPPARSIARTAWLVALRTYLVLGSVAVVAKVLRAIAH
jgi:NRAMP (natural resistance-associated macrophage protein)-like metal ion transporter